jgi:Glycosyl hydrolase family 26
MTRYHQLSKSKCFSETTGRPPLLDPVSFGIAPILRLAIFMFALLTLVSWSGGAESTRPNFGARLEPTDGRLIVGAGQRPEGFKDYYDSIGANKPIMYMTYMKLDGADTPARFAKLKEELAKYPQTFLIPQIGLSMTGNRNPEEHYEHKVAAGELDAQIDQFCAGLKDLGRPAYIRIGYEFNGHWNGYKPATYKAAFRRVTEKIRKAGLENVATVWCLGSGAKNWDFMSFYPGDDVVDWWAIDMFEVEHMEMKKTQEFMAASMEHRRPVMIGESSPKGMRLAKGPKMWDAWFDPYFQFIHRYKNVKAFCYINQDWDAIGTWKGWGDSRLSQNEKILKKFQEQISMEMFLHGTNREQTLKALRIKE